MLAYPYFNDFIINTNQIYNINCIDGVKCIEDESIDMVLTSPPYDNLRNYKNNITLTWGEHIWKPLIEELYRVLKNNSVVVWIIGDAVINGSETGTSFSQALYFKEVGFNIHDTMIYQKQTPIPQFKTHRYTNAFEYMFVFSKGKPLKGKLIEVPTKCSGRIDVNYRGQVTANEKYIGKKIKMIKNTKIKSNIWIFSQNNGIDRKINHKAQFPEQLANDHIISWSNENDIILDPFMGSGTTAKMAILNNRKFIGFEISEEYCSIAYNRLKKL
ncbi:DNA-methyltransferase [Helicobacter pullorum]|uniref:DNA-methyltransferase n=1 Tax=Helicobacter pullorum TaxID=35818 RepID=UPI00081693BE|nr:site-specific DNA-methyltransferase [Helicobacter pullorum]OCR05777.1 hypothetical protein A7X13_09760 [Helicobacter pullorum]